MPFSQKIPDDLNVCVCVCMCVCLCVRRRRSSYQGGQETCRTATSNWRSARQWAGEGRSAVPSHAADSRESVGGGGETAQDSNLKFWTLN